MTGEVCNENMFSGLSISQSKQRLVNLKVLDMLCYASMIALVTAAMYIADIHIVISYVVQFWLICQSFDCIESADDARIQVWHDYATRLQSNQSAQQNGH